MRAKSYPLLAILCFAAGAATPEKVAPEKIIDACLRARGGAKAIAQIRAESIAASVRDASTGETGSYALILKAPNRYYFETIVGENRAVQAYNGMSAWGQDSREGARTLTGPAARETEAAARYANGRLADLKKSKLIARMIGLENVRGRDAYHIQLLLGPGIAREVFFDSQTHLIVREVAPALSEQFDYDDYRPVNGIEIPYRIELRRAGRVFEITVTRAELNARVDDSVFDFPRSSGAPLPDIKSLIREVSKNQHAIEEMQKQYTCRLDVEEEKVDSKSNVTSKTSKEFEVFNIAGEEARHLIAKDGKPLAGSEKAKEDERFNHEFRKLEDQARKQAEQAADPKKQQKHDEKQDAQISDFLRALSFRNARRERFRGQEVIAVDFGPNPDYKPKKAIEGLLQKLAGVVWIDEQARDVARLEAHFADTAKLAGGLLASIDKGSSLVFEQAKVNNEVWLPTYAEVRFAARLLLVKKRASEIYRYSDYKKFRAESKIVGVQN